MRTRDEFKAIRAKSHATDGAVETEDLSLAGPDVKYLDVVAAHGKGEEIFLHGRKGNGIGEAAGVDFVDDRPGRNVDDVDKPTVVASCRDQLAVSAPRQVLRRDIFSLITVGRPVCEDI